MSASASHRNLAAFHTVASLIRKLAVGSLRGLGHVRMCASCCREDAFFKIVNKLVTKYMDPTTNPLNDGGKLKDVRPPT